MAETEEIKSKKDNLLERMRGKHPDSNFDDDEMLYGQIVDDLDESDNTLNDYRERERQLSDMFSSDPRSAKFLTDWKDGGDPAIALVRQFGTEIKDAIDDPERLEEIAEANKEFVERVAKEKELEDEYQKNLQQSIAEMTAYQESHELSDEDIDAAMEFIIGIIQDGVMGKFSQETIGMAMKAINHDMDVENASIEGEVRGKNAKIDAKLRKSNKGDGTAVLAGKNNPAGAPRQDMGALDRFGGELQDIWSKGGLTRRKA